jgi:hypothetical protein
MQVILKWIAQFLLLPLLKDLGVWIADQVKKRAERKKLEAENKKKQEAYENSSSDTAHDDFERLP